MPIVSLGVPVGVGEQATPPGQAQDFHQVIRPENTHQRPGRRGNNPS